MYSRGKQYFYQKTRNYRVILAASRLGAKYGAALSGATALFVLMDETAGWMREEYFGPRGTETSNGDENEDDGLLRKKVTWRKGAVGWEDGTIAGGLLAIGAGTFCESDKSV